MCRKSQHHRPPNLWKVRAGAVAHNTTVHPHVTKSHSSQSGLRADLRLSVPLSIRTYSVSIPPATLNTRLAIRCRQVHVSSQHPHVFWFVWVFFTLLLVRKCQPLWVSHRKWIGNLQIPLNTHKLSHDLLLLFQWMVPCNSKKPGLLNSDRIVPGSKMCGCFTRQMPTLPGAGQAHNHFRLTEELLTLFFKKQSRMHKCRFVGH